MEMEEEEGEEVEEPISQCTDSTVNARAKPVWPPPLVSIEASAEIQDW